MTDIKGVEVDSSFLFATPSFLSGASRVLDLGGVFDHYNGSATAEEADMKALSRDWSIIGKDMEIAFAQVHDRVQAEKA